MAFCNITNTGERPEPGLALCLRVGALLIAASAALTLLGCAAAMVPVVGSVAVTGAAVYASQASQHATAATLDARPREVYAGMLRLAGKSTELRVVKTDESRLQVEMAQGQKSLTAEATELGESETLLYIWANTGSSGQPARDYARAFLSQLSDELNVEHKLVEM